MADPTRRRIKPLRPRLPRAPIARLTAYCGYLDKDVWLVSLPPGDHVLRVTKPGFRPRESRFGIAAGQNVRLDVKLLPDSEG
jgi:hypothetical protein